MTPEERDRFDYEQTLRLFSQLSDIRFKVLALVPSAAGLGVVFKGNDGIDTPRQFALGILGFVATLGIVVYELRNTHFYNECIGRAQFLEGELSLSRARGDARGGWFNSRTSNDRKLLGLIELKHDRGLGLVYGSSLGAWAFIAASAWLPASAAGAVAVVVALAFILDFERHDGGFDSYVVRWGMARPAAEVFSYLLRPVEANTPRWEKDVLHLTPVPERPLEIATKRVGVEGASSRLELVSRDETKRVATWRIHGYGSCRNHPLCGAPDGRRREQRRSQGRLRCSLAVSASSKLGLSKREGEEYLHQISHIIETSSVES